MAHPPTRPFRLLTDLFPLPTSRFPLTTHTYYSLVSTLLQAVHRQITTYCLLLTFHYLFYRPLTDPEGRTGAESGVSGEISFELKYES